MLFIVDAMLGNIAKKLRLLGFDSTYFSDIADSDLLEKAKNENRIIISKDNALIRQAKKNKISSIHISQENEIEQFLEILKTVPLGLNIVSGDTARCPKCNSETSPVPKSSLENKINSRILEYHEKFWKCDGCDQIYWEGTHVKNLQDFVEKINSLV